MLHDDAAVWSSTAFFRSSGSRKPSGVGRVTILDAEVGEVGGQRLPVFRVNALGDDDLAASGR